MVSRLSFGRLALRVHGALITKSCDDYNLFMPFLILLVLVIAGNDDTKRIKWIDDEMASNAKDSNCTDATPMESFTSFPEKLMQMLDSDEFSGIVYWSGYGDSFCINTKKFIEKVLDVYFQGSKFESFVRKLNRWGFKRTYHPDFRCETIGYQHPMFRKGRPELLTSLSNRKKQKKKTAVSSTPKQEAPLLKVMECHSTKTTGTFKKTTDPAPARNTNALQGQQQVSQSFNPMQYRQQPIESILASSRQLHLQHQHKQLHLQHQLLISECLSRMTLFHQSLPIPHNPTAVELLRSGNGLLPLSLPTTLPTAQLQKHFSIEDQHTRSL